MARNMIAYGLLANGNYGILIDPVTMHPMATVLEVLPSLPSAASSDNYPGRAVYDKTTNKAYVFSDTPSVKWSAMEGTPATVGSVNGSPPTVPAPDAGEMYWDLTTQVLYIWNGTIWEKAGGRYAATFLENRYTGNGTQTVYPTGASTVVQTSHVEVFIDGVRQYPVTDYTTVGTNVNFTSAPPSGVTILVRVIDSQEIVKSAEITSALITATAGQTDFISGQAGSNPSGVFVYVDGVFMSGGGVDYTLVQKSTAITSLTKLNSTTLRATTQQEHSIPVNSTVTLGGILEPQYNNVSFTVINTATSTTFDVTVPSAAPASGTPNPSMFYTPAFVNDIVRFTVPRTAGQRVDIRSLRGIAVPGAAAGETNTLGSIGGGVSLVGAKAGTTLQVKSLVAGDNITFTSSANTVTIRADKGLKFENRIGINTTVYEPVDETYVGVRNTSFPVTIDLGANIAQNPANTGRRITIKDESLAAATNGIIVTGGGALIDGQADYEINTNGGYVTLVMDGTNWFIVGSA